MKMIDIETKLNEIEKDFKELELKMAAPLSPKELQTFGRRHSQLAVIVGKYNEYRNLLKEIAEAKELIHCGDAEIETLAREELDTKEPRVGVHLEELKILLLPKDPNDDKTVIVEVRAGTGGEEAALFAADLYRMYVRYAERNSWRVETLEANETGIGGYKEVIFRIDAEGAYSKLKYESGVHRVQRVPVTEASGRIHTSAATVAVLPEAEDIDIEIRQEDLKIDTYRSSGAGGQHVNTTDSAIRITHIPTGIIVTCQDERSQIKNRARAMSYLKTKLYDIQMQKQAEEQASERRRQVGTGDRSERIRTYNFPQNRVTDHRVNVTIYKLDQYLDGDLYDLIEALSVADQTERLHKLSE